jgi:cytochrome c2
MRTLPHLRTALLGLLGAALSAAVVPPAHAAGDPAKGAAIFKQRCAGCHDGGPSALGPSLAGVIGRLPGTTSGGVHSRALLEREEPWTEASLRKYLAAPSEQAPGTNMPKSVVPAAQLDDVIAYLKTLK